MQSRSGSELSTTLISKTSGVLQQGDEEGQGFYEFSNNIDFNKLNAGLNTEQNQILFLHEVLSATSTLDTQLKDVSAMSSVRRGYDLFKVFLSADSKYLIFSIMS